MKGPLNLYFLKDSIGEHYFLEKENIGTTEYIFVEESGRRAKHRKDRLIHYQSLDRVDSLNIFYQSIYKVDSVDIFKDHPKYPAKVAQMVYLNHRKMGRLAVQYNKHVCGYKNPVLFEKDLIKSHVIFEPSIARANFSGIEYFNKLKNYRDINYYQKGLLIHFRMLNYRNLYFRTGVSYTLLQNKYTSAEDLLKIPIQFEYASYKRFINPKLATGFNYYHNYFFSAVLMAGINVKINNTFNLGFSYEIDRGISLPYTLSSQSISAGLQIRI